MCGFVVFVGQNGRKIEPAVLERMTETLAHRGPNDAGFWYHGTGAIGFRRLSIIDTSLRGHQPMTSRDGKNVIAFNGEIYNHVELRQELKALGHRFTSASDTEVLLASWLQWGDDCVDRLEGMFAFVIWDEKTKEFFGARDRFGIKPLYVYQGNDAVILASEIKAIQASGILPTRINWPVVARYLVDGIFDQPDTTCFEGIHEVPAAHTFRVGARGLMKLRRYFALPTEIEPDPKDVPEVLAEMLDRAVRMHMRADVGLGVCLSGGLDSTALICGMARNQSLSNTDNPLMAFSYNAPEFDETRYVDATVKQTGVQLVRWEGTPQDLWDNLPRLLYSHDEPVHSMNTLIGFELMRLARDHGALVLLNGSAADEVLGGYSSHYSDYWTSLVAQGQPARAWREIHAYATAFGANSQQLAAQVCRTIALRGARLVPGYESRRHAARRRSLEKNPWFTADLASQTPNRPQSRALGIDSSQRESLVASPLPLYLRIEDRNSMAHGVEARVPFLDHRLVSYALTLPVHWRIRGPWNKYALREASRGRIPDVVRNRMDKMGFAVPTAKWFGQELNEPLRAVIDTKSARESGLYRVDNLLRTLEAGAGAEIPDHGPIFRAANIEIWLQMLADREPSCSVGRSTASIISA